MSIVAVKGLIAIFFIIGILCIFDKKYPSALYFISAGFLNIAVLWMMK